MDLHGIDLNLLVAIDALMPAQHHQGGDTHRTHTAMSAALSRLRSLLRNELFVHVLAAGEYQDKVCRCLSGNCLSGNSAVMSGGC